MRYSFQLECNTPETRRILKTGRLPLARGSLVSQGEAKQLFRREKSFTAPVDRRPADASCGYPGDTATVVSRDPGRSDVGDVSAVRDRKDPPRFADLRLVLVGTVCVASRGRVGSTDTGGIMPTCGNELEVDFLMQITLPPDLQPTNEMLTLTAAIDEFNGEWIYRRCWNAYRWFFDRFRW
jgi:hypothetical protein